MKNTLTTHISRIFVVLLHFFNDVNVKTLSCYIFSFIKRTHPQILKDLSKSHDQTVKTQGFFLPFHAGMGQVAAKQSQQQHTKIQSS